MNAAVSYLTDKRTGIANGEVKSRLCELSRKRCGLSALSKIRASANGKSCTLRLPGCEHRETVVFAHIRTKATGWAVKPPDSMGVYACHSCHDIIDGRKGQGLMEKEVLGRIIAALAETHQQLLNEGLMVLK